MQDFSQEISTWQPLFITLIGVGATLAGLLFVALSLHVGALHREEGTNLQRLAQHTFGDLVQILLVGMFFSVPLGPPAFYGISTLLIVVFGMPNLGTRILRAVRDKHHTQHRLYLFRRLGASVLGRIVLVLGAVGILRSHDNGRPWGELLFVFIGNVVLLIAVMSNAWFLLTQESGMKKKRPA